MKFTNSNLDDIRTELNRVLKSYGIQHNIDFKIGRISYTDNSFRTTLECFNTEDVGSAEQASYEQNCMRYGLKKEWFGQTVHLNGKDYMVHGINTRARKYPISLKNVESGIVDRKCSPDVIKVQLRDKV